MNPTALVTANLPVCAGDVVTGTPGQNRRAFGGAGVGLCDGAGYSYWD